MEGHPWWPGIVWQHPRSKKITRGKGTRMECHLHFFGQPQTRGWVRLDCTKAFTIENSKDFTNNEEGFDIAVEEAKAAHKLSISDRSTLIQAIPSDDEDEMECEDQENVTPDEKSGKVVKRRKRAFFADDSDNDDTTSNVKTQPKKKSKAIILSDSEDDYNPGDVSSEDESVSSGVEEVDSGHPSEEEDMEYDKPTPVSSRKKTKVSSSKPKTPTTSKTPTMLQSVKTPKTPTTTRTPGSSSALDSTPSAGLVSSTGNSREPGSFTHEKLSWLSEENRKDKNGRRPHDPNYDPRTVLVPREFLKSLTPALRQWWEIKASNFDTVLFFKVGKFYELYHMDAVIGVQELGLIYMKGGTAHSGFPEKCFGRFADMLVEKGYKVARVEQTETPQMMDERVKRTPGSTKFDKVVRRELCSIISKGTRTLGALISGEMTSAESNFLLAITEKPVDGAPGQSLLGVCFIDTCIGLFHLGQFVDDRQCSRLRTLVAHHPPAQVLYPRGQLSQKVMNVVQHQLTGALREALTPGTEFWDASKTLKNLAEAMYFIEEEECKSDEEGQTLDARGCEVMWPEVLKDMFSADDSLGLRASSVCEQAVSALGACVWYLKKCKIDHEIISLKKFEVYQPIDADVKASQEEMDHYIATRQHMVLDGTTLANLDVVDVGGGLEGTLLERIDHTVTPFGKRLLKQWLCAPLCKVQEINDRLDAIEDILATPVLAGESWEILKKLPDLERLLRKIHTLGSKVRGRDHPDSRAILYEEALYSKKKISDFLSVLSGFEAGMGIVDVFAGHAQGFKSHLLRHIVTLAKDGGLFPEMMSELNFFKTSFDQAKAKKDGVIVPNEGVSKSYDRAMKDINCIKRELAEYLDRQRRRLGSQGINYWGSGRNRFQLEVPERALSRHTPNDYDLRSQRKGYKRYWTKEIEDMLARMIDAEERRDAALKDTMRTIFHSFDTHFKLWDSAVECLAVLDVLISLSTYSGSSDGYMCRPVFSIAQHPFINLENGRHPCVTRTFSGDDFIPNDTAIGCSQEGPGPSCVVVTGPNMGGKSTLMRQNGLIVILAHLGCFVPAESCSLSPVDRIFTRLGASDRIMSGESTFYVELSETAAILQHATKHSLVLLDELGRGTATYDGTAIACSVVKELTENVKCRTLFSTHYHSLVEEFAGNPNIGLGHMACMVENEGIDEEGATSEETITFLYKLSSGACPKSYGFNAAKLAGIPSDIITTARQKSREFEESTERHKLFREVFEGDGCSIVRMRELQDTLNNLVP
jgi:DNA mismatch repair protein MSH6